jgi:hypothetical protein
MLRQLKITAFTDVRRIDAWCLSERESITEHDGRG